MVGRRDNDEIDVAQEVQNTRVAGERGGMGEDTARRRTPGMRIFMILVIGVAAVLGSFLTWRGFQHSRSQNQPTPAKVANTLPPLPPYVPHPASGSTAAPAAPASAAAAVPGPALGAAFAGNGNGQPQKSPEELLRERRFGGGFDGGGSDQGSNGSGGSSGTSQPASPNAANGNNPLENQLQPLQLKPSTAGMLAHRDFLLTRGAMIDCGEQSKLVTDQPGMVSCYTTSDTYSANGHVVLIDAGSKIVGSYQRGIQQGQTRVFVAWQRIETPQGVIIDLDSPGTDPLGAAGLPGQVDTHFWQRFGGAIMLSLLGDLGQAAVNAAQTSTNTNITLGNTQSTTQELANTALQNSINIPPTLYRNQGDRVNIFVARDLDFSSVYSIQ
jgi:type IV secretion system protein VirB10